MKKLEIENYIGCIVGGAIGDALGAPTEFMRLDAIIEKFGSQGVNDYVEFENGLGEITDDTQMLLFTAEGLLRSWHRATVRGIWGAYTTICFDSYLRWLKTQDDWYGGQALLNLSLDGWLLNEEFLYKRRAPGATCLSALRTGRPGTIENPINNSKGCGGIMRIAPVGLLFYNAPINAFKVGAELAAMTHGHPTGYLSAGFLAALISFINNGRSLLDSIQESSKILKTYDQHQETLDYVRNAIALSELNNPSYKQLETLGAGWVAEEALAISLYCCLSYENNFEKAINLAINHSGDTDSTGAITGNISGLLLGEKAIPWRWISNLKNYETIKQIGMDLHTEVKGNGYDQFDRDWERKYPTY
jgi:ADP-ribosylglycohydrolase